MKTALHLLLLAVVGLTSATFPASTPSMITYWGQNRGVRVIGDEAKQEPTLAQICDLPQFSVVVLSFMMEHFSVKGDPGLDFSKWCGAEKNTYSGYSLTGAGSTMLNCPQIGTWITYCQSLGKTVLLGIRPQAALKSESQGEASADKVWNIFLGGSSSVKPFGAGVKLDGVDFLVRNNDNVGYSSMIRILRQNMIGDSSKSYYMSVSPTCDYVIESSFLMQPVIVARKTDLDWINVFFLASSSCTWTKNRAGFWNNFDMWASQAASWNLKMFMTTVGVGYDGFEAYVDGMNGDFIYPFEMQTQNVMGTMKTKPAFGGITLFDSSFESINPCIATNQSYSAIIYEQLSGSPAVTGNNTVTKCILKPNLFPRRAVKNTTDTATGDPLESWAFAMTLETSFIGLAILSGVFVYGLI